jgi:NADH-quinone oxidoreductase subunit M
MLAWITFIPLLGALTVFLIRRDNRQAVGAWGLIFSGFTLLLSLLLLSGFNGEYGAFEFIIRRDWVPDLGIEFLMGVDGISLWMILLTAFLTPITILFSSGSVKHSQRFYFYWKPD